MEVNLDTCRLRVKRFLENDPQTRESDTYLAFQFWKDECEQLGINSLSDFFSSLTNKKGVTHFSSIARSRRKWQEELPYLQGKNRKEKMAKQNIVVGDLSTLFNIGGGHTP